ncbi:MAG: acetylornithine deacetylase [Gammaproteobacteria bacterium]
MKSSLLDVKTVLEELVRIPSVSSVSPEFDTPNRALIERIADYFEGLGWQTEIMDLSTPGKANLVATLGAGEGGLALAGHSDTVPFDADAWSSDPFRLSERDGRLHGLGAVDMKGFIAVCIVLASRITAAQLARPLHVVVTADEESRMDGARLLVENGRPRAGYCIVGEPTDLKPVRMHKGVLMEALVVEGGSGHSSDPDAAPNALEGMSRLLAALIEWRGEMKRDHHAPDFAVPHPTLNLGYLHGGDNPNRICAQAELHIDLRPVPGMQLEELRDALDRRMQCALEGSGCNYRRRSLFDGIAPFETPRESRLVRLTEELTGVRAHAVSFGTEAGFFTEMGMETIVLGPGRIGEAHKADEYIEVMALAEAEKLFGKIIERLVCR